MGKRLVDLYTIGEEVSFEDPDGGPPLVVYLKKPQPFELEVAMNRANKERAKVLTLKKLPKDSDEVILFDLQASELFSNKEEVILFAASEELGKALKSIESETAHQDEWSKDDYLEGLQDAWGDLETHYYADDFPEEHAEAVRVFNELKRYQAAVDEQFESRKKMILRTYEEKDEDELRAIIVDRLIDMRADIRWIEEFKKSQIWLTVKDNKNRRENYFSDRSEVDHLSQFVYQRLSDVLDGLTITPDEGKG